MICPNCKIAMLKCKRLGLVYLYCTRCKCTIETTSNDYGKGYLMKGLKPEDLELVESYLGGRK